MFADLPPDEGVPEPLTVMRVRSSLLAFILTVIAPLSAWPSEGEAFYNIKVGDAVPNPELPTVDGKRMKVLGDGADVSVFLIFKPDQENSRLVLDQLAGCMQGIASSRVHLVGVVSDAYPRADVEAALKEAKLDLTVLVDEGNALYAQLGTVLTPVVGIADKRHVLHAYLPFQKVGLCDALRAQVRHGLGEISDQELDQVLHPAAAINGADESIAKRDIKLGAILYASKDFDKALPLAQKAVTKAPQLAAAQGLLAAILAAQQKCEEAQPYWKKALEIDASEPKALEAAAACGSR